MDVFLYWFFVIKFINIYMSKRCTGKMVKSVLMGKVGWKCILFLKFFVVIYSLYCDIVRGFWGVSFVFYLFIV